MARSEVPRFPRRCSPGPKPAAPRERRAGPRAIRKRERVSGRLLARRGQPIFMVGPLIVLGGDGDADVRVSLRRMRGEFRPYREHLRAWDGQAGLSEVWQRENRERAHRIRGGDRQEELIRRLRCAGIISSRGWPSLQTVRPRDRSRRKSPRPRAAGRVVRHDHARRSSACAPGVAGAAVSPARRDLVARGTGTPDLDHALIPWSCCARSRTGNHTLGIVHDAGLPVQRELRPG